MVTSNKPIPPHVVEQRAGVASGKRPKYIRGHKVSAERYEVFKRINMHDGDKVVCWEWCGAHGTGTRGEYRPRVCIAGKHFYVYRVVYELYTGYTLGAREVVRHSCDNSWCCNPYHMLIGSQADNVADMMQRERAGMKHYQIKRIMSMLELGCTAVYVCQKMREGYNISLDKSMIRKIRLRNVYANIPWPWGDDYAARRKRRLAAIRAHRLAGVAEPAIIGTSNQGEKDGKEES